MGGLNKNRLKRPKKVEEPDWVLEEGLYTPPPRDQCEESTMAHMVSRETPLVRTTGRTWKQGRLVDFTISVQYRVDESAAWVDHVTIDCSHSVAHIHTYEDGERDGRPPELIKRLDDVADLKEALGLSLNRAKYERSRLELKLGKGT